jgi:uncharacterized protein with ATP-grasp and redox domains
MAVLCQLRDPESYRPCDWDLVADPLGREHWIDEFLEHGEAMIDCALTRRDPPPRDRADAMRSDFRHVLESLRFRSDFRGRLDVLELCILRDELLQRYEIGDPYADVKRIENERSLERYPSYVERIDATPEDRRVEHLIRGVLAGNRFDLGSPATRQEYHRGEMDFLAELDRLRPRPWADDDLDTVVRAFRRNAGRYRKLLFFVDNAGADIVLGVLPLARHLAEAGMRVVLAATDHYALNDVTRKELDGILETVRRVDDIFARHLADGTITVVGTGYGHPLIDLTNVSEECNSAAADCDLIVLEGMGRAIESNYRTEFCCDCLRLAMIKNDAVARYYGFRMFDLVCRLDSGSAS